MFPLGSVLVPGQMLPLQVFERATERWWRVAWPVTVGSGWCSSSGDPRWVVATCGSRSAPIARDRTGGVESRRSVPAHRGRNRSVPGGGMAGRSPVPAGERRADHRAGGGCRCARTARGGRGRVRAGARRGAGPGWRGSPEVRLADDPVQAGWDAVALAPIGPLDVLTILREDDPVARLDLVVAALTDAIEILQSRLD